MKIVAIITARGGSKRIPRKNIKSFCGRPIIEYSIKAALACEVFDEVMVSTDDTEIARISEDAGALVPFMRSEINSNDYADTASVIKEVLKSYSEENVFFDAFCCIYPTVPFITPEILKDAFSLLNTEGTNAVIPIVAFGYPVQRSFKLENDLIVMNWPEHYSSRSQDLQPFYHDCGQFYMMLTKVFSKDGVLLPKGTRPIFMNELEVQDIDTITDWKIAEIKYKLMQNK